MNTRQIVWFTALIIILSTTLYVFYLRIEGINYAVRGRIAGFTDEPNRVIIEHEKIIGYMEAMTMPFNVKSDELEGLKLNDAISFKYYVKSDTSWIEQLNQLDNNELPPPGEIAKIEFGYFHGKKNENLVEVGDYFPKITMYNQDNINFSIDTYKGQEVLITFIYTRCPVPDFCPLMTSHFKEIKSLFDAENLQMNYLSISFDPEYDTAEILKRYGSNHTKDFRSWQFASAQLEEMQELTSALSIVTATDNDQIVHNLRTIYVNKEGKIQKIWPGNRWTPEEVVEYLKSR